LEVLTVAAVLWDILELAQHKAPKQRVPVVVVQLAPTVIIALTQVLLAAVVVLVFWGKDLTALLRLLMMVPGVTEVLEDLTVLAARLPTQVVLGVLTAAAAAVLNGTVLRRAEMAA
jgi:hypothetical protein